jgi:hypothetical protein
LRTFEGGGDMSDCDLLLIACFTEVEACRPMTVPLMMLIDELQTMDDDTAEVVRAKGFRMGVYRFNDALYYSLYYLHPDRQCRPMDGAVLLLDPTYFERSLAKMQDVLEGVFDDACHLWGPDVYYRDLH